MELINLLHELVLTFNGEVSTDQNTIIKLFKVIFSVDQFIKILQLIKNTAILINCQIIFILVNFMTFCMFISRLV